MNQIALMYAAYALLLIVGGVSGYAKAKSKPSLISGIATGVISLILAIVSLRVPYQGTVLVIGAVLGFALGVFFVIRFGKTRKPMPAIPMAILSIGVAVGSLVILSLRHAA